MLNNNILKIICTYSTNLIHTVRSSLLETHEGYVYVMVKIPQKPSRWISWRFPHKNAISSRLGARCKTKWNYLIRLKNNPLSNLKGPFTQWQREGCPPLQTETQHYPGFHTCSLWIRTLFLKWDSKARSISKFMKTLSQKWCTGFHRTTLSGFQISNFSVRPLDYRQKKVLFLISGINIKS